MAEPEQAIPEHITQQALNLLNRELHGYGTDENIDAASEHDFDVLAHALLSAEAGGRAAQREADARIAEAYAFDNAAIGEDWTVEFAPNERTVGSAIATTIRNS